MALKEFLILRKLQGGRLEGRTALIQWIFNMLRRSQRAHFAR